MASKYDMKIYDIGFQHYQNENIVLVEINVDEIIKEYSEPKYTESGWKSFDLKYILNKATDIFHKLDVNNFSYPKFIGGTRDTLERFAVNFGNNYWNDDIFKHTFNCLEPFEIKVYSEKFVFPKDNCLYVCSDKDFVVKINESCFGNYILVIK